MRVSDDRYTRDRQRLDLALRLIRHEARTFTIRQWTGLSDDRIRKLYRSYVMNLEVRAACPGIAASRRARQLFSSATAELNFQSAQLASLYVMYGLLGGTDAGLEPRYRVGSLESGTLLCQAYEAYLELHAPAGHFLRACVVPAARAGATRRSRHLALRRVRRSASARSAGQAQDGLCHLRSGGPGAAYSRPS